MRNMVKRIIITLMLVLLAIVALSIGKEAKSNSSTLLWVDTPGEDRVVKDTLYINGWNLSEEADRYIKVTVDGEDFSVNIRFEKRDDVLKSVSGFGGVETNATPGFYGNIDLKQYADGKHKLVISVRSKKNDHELAKKEISFVTRQYGTLIWVDSPAQNSKVKNKLNIQGWNLSEDANREVTALIDNIDVTQNLKFQQRDDVVKAVQGYGGVLTNKTPGFYGEIDVLNLDEGEHNLTIRVRDVETRKTIGEKIVKFFVKNYESLIWIDTPAVDSTVKNKVSINGWNLSEDAERIVKAYIDDKDVTTQLKFQKRDDVVNAIQGYGGAKTNATPGFYGSVDVSGLKDGQHELKIVLEDKNTTKQLQTKKVQFKIKKYDSLIWIDSPAENVSGTTLSINGWNLSENSNREIEAYIDDKDVTTQLKFQKRDDVVNAIQGYGGAKTNATPGFYGVYDSSNLSDGTHKIKILLKDKITKEVYESNEKEFSLKKYDAYITIDYPQAWTNNRDSMYIQGWQLSSLAERKIEVWINGDNVTDKISTYSRQDAVNAMKGKGYGDETTNECAGFSGTIDIRNYDSGDYILKVRVLSTKTSELLSETSRIIGINKITFEIGTFGYSGLRVAGDSRGTNLKYYRFGDGPNVFFATFVVHGFEDHFGRDGTEISIIAENFINELRARNDSNLARKWTIYIFPEINPDGRNYGWSHDGPGRTSLYSAASGNKGIDINRCWSTNFVPMYNDRNYTGSTPFNSYESRYLRDFLLSKKSTTGQTVLVDLHGWTTQVIGDGEICGYYKQKFPSNLYTSSYGKGYLINWARSSLGANGRTARSALIELPAYGAGGKKIMSHQDVVNSDYSRKYIDATLNMLKGIV